MIRSTRPDDISALIALAVAAEMFPADDTSVLDKMFADYFGREFNHGDVCVTDHGRRCFVLPKRCITSAKHSISRVFKWATLVSA